MNTATNTDDVAKLNSKNDVLTVALILAQHRLTELRPHYTGLFGMSMDRDLGTIKDALGLHASAEGVKAAQLMQENEQLRMKLANANVHRQHLLTQSKEWGAERDRLAAALAQCLNYIEHKVANDGQATTAEQWAANVAQFRKTVAHVSVGRTAVPEAEVNLAVVRSLLNTQAGATAV